MLSSPERISDEDEEQFSRAGEAVGSIDSPLSSFSPKAAAAAAAKTPYSPQGLLMVAAFTYQKHSGWSAGHGKDEGHLWLAQCYGSRIVVETVAQTRADGAIRVCRDFLFNGWACFTQTATIANTCCTINCICYCLVGLLLNHRRRTGFDSRRCACPFPIT